MHRIVVILAICLVSAWAIAARGAASAAVDQQTIAAAAQQSAVDRLAADMSGVSITPAITVKSFLDQTHSRAKFLAALGASQPIGGPRWIDDQTCQIQINVAGGDVRWQLRMIALDNAAISPLLPNQVSAGLVSWDGQTFSATGSATCNIDSIRPPTDSVVWHNATDPEIHDALIAARQDAVDKVLGGIAIVPLAGDKKISDALANADIKKSISDWLLDRPITLADFRDDGSVQLTLYVPAAGLTDQLRKQLSGQAGIIVLANDKEWAAVADAIASQMPPAVGQSAAVTFAVTASLGGWTLPNEAPAWIDTQLDAAGSGAGGTQLLAARAAEVAATENLRQQIMQLEISPKVNLQALAAKEPRFAAAIDRTLASRSHVYSITYQPDGSASVRMSVDLRDLWEMLWLAR
jgi:hypothetical protein